jgi:hypothetical protein
MAYATPTCSGLAAFCFCLQVTPEQLLSYGALLVQGIEWTMPMCGVAIQKMMNRLAIFLFLFPLRIIQSYAPSLIAWQYQFQILLESLFPCNGKIYTPYYGRLLANLNNGT